jgi:hypothetical protein
MLKATVHKLRGNVRKHQPFRGGLYSPACLYLIVKGQKETIDFFLVK